MKRRFLNLALGALVAGTLIPAAFAGIELGLTDSGNFTTGDWIIVDGTGAIVSQGGSITTLVHIGSGGVITWDGSIGNYNVNVSTGQGAPAQPVSDIDLNSVNTASGSSSGPLDVFFSENGITTGFAGWNMTFGGTLNSGAGATITGKGFEDNNDAFFGTTKTIGSIGPFGPGAFSGSASGPSGGVVTSASYSLTLEVLINGVGTTTYSGDSNLTPVPEPASIMLLGGILLGSAVMLRRKARIQ